MGIAWEGGTFKDAAKHIAVVSEGVIESAVEALEETMIGAVEDMQHSIMNAPGTAKTGYAVGPRWEAGYMHNMVDYTVNQVSSRSAEGEFGWLVEGSEGYEHAKHQDQVDDRPYEKVDALFPAHSLAMIRFRQELAARGLDIE